jgi:hypothetical protein
MPDQQPRKTRSSSRASVRILIVLALLNSLCGSSLWAGGPRIATGMPIVVVRLDAHWSLLVTVQLISTIEQPFGYIPASWVSWPPNALQLHVRVRDGSRHVVVYVSAYTVSLRLLAVLPIGAALALVALIVAFRRRDQVPK